MYFETKWKWPCFFHPYFVLKSSMTRVFPNFWNVRHFNVLKRPHVWGTVHAPIELHGTCKGTTQSPLKPRMKLSIYRVERGLSGSLITAFLDLRSHNSSVSVINYSNTLLLWYRIVSQYIVFIVRHRFNSTSEHCQLSCVFF